MGAFITSFAVSELNSGIPGGRNPQTYSMTCALPASTPGSANNNQNPTPSSVPTQPVTYFFDATLRVEQVQEAVGTKHPVQVGPAIIDHVYLLPARVTLDVAMSDSMQSFLAGQYSGAGSRSVNAWQTFKAIQAARVPVALATRLQAYQNLWLLDVRATEDRSTSRSLRCMLRFEQIIGAQVGQSNISNRPNATGVTSEGSKGVIPPPPNLAGLTMGSP